MRFTSSLLVPSVVVSLAVWLLPGCNCAGPGPRDAGRYDGSAGMETGAQCRDGLDNDRDGRLDCADPDCVGTMECEGVDGGPGRDTGFEECTGMDYVAETRNAPVDVIFVIDNSGSMDEEASQIQMRLNSFVAAIGAAGIEDYHVVMLTQAGFVTVPDPLGSDTMRYRYVDTNVQSHDSFQRLLEQLPMFMSFLRPTAVTHVVFVTDDEAEDLTYMSFQSMFTAAIGHDFFAHAIVSPPGSTHMECPIPGFCTPALPGCTGPGGDAAGNGQQYWSLATVTGGLHLSICADDWGALFDELLTLVAVPTAIPCRFTIPAPPDGMMLDPNRVNVVYTPTGGAPRTIPRAASGDCSGDGFTWVYDNPSAPTEILLCTDACNTVEADPSGAVRIQLGCDTVLM